MSLRSTVGGIFCSTIRRITMRPTLTTSLSATGAYRVNTPTALDFLDTGGISETRMDRASPSYIAGRRLSLLVPSLWSTPQQGTRDQNSPHCHLYGGYVKYGGHGDHDDQGDCGTCPLFWDLSPFSGLALHITPFALKVGLKTMLTGGRLHFGYGFEGI